MPGPGEPTEAEAPSGPAPPSGARRWVIDRGEWPWFEHPGALARVPEIAARWGGGEQLEAWLEQWVTEGYFVAEGFVPPDMLDGIGEALDDIWTAHEPVPGLNFEDLKIDGEGAIQCPHHRLVEKSEGERVEIERRSFWRIAGLHHFDPRARRLFDFDGFRRVASAVFDRDAAPLFSLTFGKGSRQPMHQDTYVFHVWPMQFICGIWIACEDVHPDSGPLAFFPGSHREPHYGGFDNYPQTQCRTASEAEIQDYGRYLQAALSRYPEKAFIAKKGDVLFWHGMLIHGGRPVSNEALSRRSFVLHVLPPGASRHHEVVGPFNW